RQMLAPFEAFSVEYDVCGSPDFSRFDVVGRDRVSRTDLVTRLKSRRLDAQMDFVRSRSAEGRVRTPLIVPFGKDFEHGCHPLDVVGDEHSANALLFHRPPKSFNESNRALLPDSAKARLDATSVEPDFQSSR